VIKLLKYFKKKLTYKGKYNCPFKGGEVEQRSAKRQVGGRAQVEENIALTKADAGGGMPPQVPIIDSVKGANLLAGRCRGTRWGVAGSPDTASRFISQN